MERVFGIRIDEQGSIKVLKDLDKEFRNVEQSSDKLDKQTQKLGKTKQQVSREVDNFKTRYLGVSAAVAGVTAVIAGSIKSYSDFQTSIAEVNTLLGSNQNIDAYSDSVRELSKQFGSTNVQQAQAMYQVISAGAGDAAEATDVLTAANKLAIGGVTDVLTAADGLTSVLNAYGLEASQAGEVSDIMFSTMRQGKALDVDTPIPTPNGFVRVGDIKAGDSVYDEQGEEQKVLYAHPIIEEAESYEVEFTDGTVIQACKDHNWLTYTDTDRHAINLQRRRKRQRLKSDRKSSAWRYPEPQVRTTKEIVDDFTPKNSKLFKYRHYVQMAEPVHYPVRDLPVDPYLLGVWLGDGTKAGARISTMDTEIVDAFVDGGYRVTKVSGDNCDYGISCSKDKRLDDGSFLRQLRQLNVLNNKHVPEVYLTASVEQRIDMLRGLMDTDGYIDEKGIGCEFSSTDLPLAQAVKELVCSLGMTARIAVKEPRQESHKVAYRVKFSPTRINPFRLPRKAERVREKYRQIPFLGIVEIRPIASRPMRCLTVTGENSLFLCGRSYIVTHNTTIGELSGSLGKVAPIASQLGVDFDELTAALATITTNGVTTSEAVTQVKAALSNVLKPSSEASELAGQLGIDFSTTGLKAHGLSGFLDLLAEATGGSEQQLAKLFGSTEAVQAIMPLAGAQAEKFREILEGNSNAAGATDVAFGKMTETIKFNFNTLKADIGDLSTSFGEFLAPAVNLGIDALQGLLSIVELVGEGLGAIIDLGADVFSWVFDLTGITDVWSEWNAEISDTNTLTGSLKEVFLDVDKVRAYFIRGALIGWENLSYGFSVAAEGIKLVWDQAIDFMQEGLASFLESTADGLEYLPFLESASTGIDEFADSLRQATDPLGDYKKAVEEIDREHEASIDQIKEITGDMLDLAYSTGETSKATKKNTEETEKNTKANSDNAESIDVVAEALGRELTVREQLILELRDSNIEYLENLERRREAKKLLDEGNISQEEYNDLLGENTKDVKDNASALENEWQNAYDAAYDTLEDFFRDGLDGWDDFTDGILDIVKDMIASILATWATSGITELFFSLFDNEPGVSFEGFNIGSLIGEGSKPNTSTNNNNVSSDAVKQAGEYLGLTDSQTQNIIGGAASVLALYNGYEQIKNGNEVGGAIQVANSGVGAYNAYQGFTGGQQLGGTAVGGLGVASGLFGLYTGIENGDYLSAGLGAYQTYQGYQALSQALQATGDVATAIDGWNQSIQVLDGINTGAQTVDTTAQLATQGGANYLQTTGQVVGVAAGAYNIYAGIDKGGTAGYTQASGGALAAYGALYSNPYTAIIGAVISILAAGRGARPYEQILQEDYLPELFGVNAGSAVGVDGGVGFNGGNTAIFGSNFGITGSGLNAQFLADGGANGNGGFFTGAQSSLEGFAEALRAAGFDELLDVENGTLRVFDKDKTVADIMEVWQSYRDGLDQAVAYNEVFGTAVRNDLLQPTNLFLEQFAIGFGESAFEARESLRSIDERFDELRDSGIAKTDALFQSISEHYGIAIEDAQYFVQQSGVAADQWVKNFEDASGKGIDALLEFDANGRTVFESVAQSALVAANDAGGYFDRLGVDASIVMETIGSESVSAAELVADSFTTNIQGLTGILSTVDLGDFQIPGIPPIVVDVIANNQVGQPVPSLGNFYTALTDSKTLTVPHGGVAAGGLDHLYTVGLVPGQEEFSVSPTGSISRIERLAAATLDVVQNSGASNVSTELLSRAVDELARASDMMTQMYREHRG